MPDVPLPDPEKTPDLRGQAAQQMAGWLDVANLNQAGTWLQTTLYSIVVGLIGWLLRNAAKLGALLGSILADAENRAAPEFSQLASVAVQDLFGVSGSISASSGGGARASRTAVANEVGEMLFKAFAGGAGAVVSGELQPTDAPAKAFLSTMTQLGLEGWLEGWIVECLTVGQIETFGELDDIISHVLGLGRASAAVHGPLVRDLIVTPLEWKLNKDHRPTLLSASACARQVARHPEQRERWLEDLRRQGYSDSRIDALLNEQRKFFSPGDLRTFVSREYWDGERAAAHLRDQGYDQATADDALRLEGLRRIDQLETSEANAIISAYASRDIDRSTFLSALNAAVTVASERALLTELAEVRRAMSVKRLSLTQVEAMAKSGVLSVVDYRRAAEREGYDDLEVTALELQLRWEMDKVKALEEHRRELEAQRAAEKQVRDAAAAAKRAEVEAARVLARRGSEADLERAVIRGLIPMARLEEIYAAHYDSDTIAILVAGIEQDRVDYVARQKALREAQQRGVTRGIDVGSIERAVLDGVLTIGQYRERLRALHFNDADADLLSADLQARLEQRTDAEAKRRDAAEAARRKSIDLGRYETLVRRGHRSLAAYDQLLASLGFDDASRAAMLELLQIHIDDDIAARQAREAADAKLRAKGVSLEQARRAVILGIRDEAWFERFLFDQGFTTEAQAVLLEELRADVTEAEAARQRRAKDPAPSEARALPLATARKAARLGLISVDAYAARLREAGYNDEDIELDVDLLLLEIADVQAARDKEGAPPAPTAPRGLTLEQLARAVTSGNATLDAYRARAAELGYSAEDIQTLSAVLEDEVVTLTAARERRAAIDAAAGGKDLTLAQLEDGVKHDLVTLEDYRAELEGRGYDPAEVDLLSALLLDDLAKAAGTPPAG